MSTIFISYRRSSDPHITGRLYDQLTRHFDVEDIFRDRESIQPADNWESQIRASLKSTKVCLVVIGPEWLDAKDSDNNKRLFQDNDWVRFEIESALAIEDIEIIPVLVKGATVPNNDDLPSGLTGLLSFQAKRLSDDNWVADCHQLIKGIKDCTGLTKCRQRMTTALIVLSIGAIYGILGAAIDLNSNEEIAIDTHLGYFSMLMVGAYVFLGKSFLAEPKPERLTVIAITYIIMTAVGISSILIGFIIWQDQYTGFFLDLMIGITMLIAGGMFFVDGRKILR